MLYHDYISVLQFCVVDVLTLYVFPSFENGLLMHAILSLCSIILPRNLYPQLIKSDAQTRETGRSYVPEHVSMIKR